MVESMRRAAGALLLAVLVAACGDPAPSLTTSPFADEAVPPASASTTSTSKPPVDGLPGERIPNTTMPPGVTGEIPEGLLSEVTTDAAGRSGVPAHEIMVVRGEAVVWPDGSLGCPAPGEAYTQATVEGYWIVLSADGHEYDFRTTAAGYFKLCEGGGLPSQPDA